MGKQTFIQKALSFLTNGRLGSENIEEKIQALLDEGEEAGEISEQEGEMIQGIFELRDTLASEIMIPRTEMTCIQLDSPLSDVPGLVSEKGHSRYPVYEDDLDHIVGILHVKDLIARHLPNGETVLKREFLRPCSFIPETKRVSDILRDFQANRFHMAVVTDEYGGTSGLVTIEDIIEEIVGDIQDEYDHEESTIQEIDQDTILIDASADIEDLEEHWDITLPPGDYESVGGFIINIVSRVPKVGEVISYQNMEFVIEKGDKRRIRRIRVRRLDSRLPATSVG